ncbi:protein translocase subunit SecD [Streptomyces palmae]|uniref:Protein translocase subunit SecD n=1 Tax=Streptomyces palmae TaxID=1701085 RepID=A0A4Z0GSX6_9ACTN|nr:protein translocase subunit SecD [Streptomyces palmae]TGB00531.1 protein translocase subunit SecD [Streptomyces palmae]
MAAPKKGRRSSGAQGRPWRALVVTLLAIVGLTAGMFAAGETTPRLGIDLAGGTSFTLEAKNQPGKPNAINSDNMNTAVNIIEQRVNGLGVSEAEVQTQGSKHIIVNIPKGTDAETARKQVGSTAQLTFRQVLQDAPGTPATKPATKPGAGDKGGKDAQDKPSGKDTAQGKKDEQGGKAAPNDTPSSKPTTQGRPVTEGLTADKDPKPNPSDPKKPAADQAAARFETLSCVDDKARLAANQQAAAARPTDNVAACGDDGRKFLLGPVQVEGTEVSDAEGRYDPQQGGWYVQLGFTGKGTKHFADVTTDLSKKPEGANRFAIVLDGRVVSDPRVSYPITDGHPTITGGFDQKEAKELANMLSYGALPLTFEIADQTTVSAALGSDQLHAGLIAGAIGLTLVVLYLVIYYRGLALVAIASLAVSATFTYTIMVLLGRAIGFALNLPAVCGAIVAIGITADSFIVYFERIRDEIREGRTLRPSVERAWPRARRTILVSDFVSFLAAAVLFVVTVGKVQGFAFTLGLTTLLDVVVVFFFTKPLMTVLAKKKFFASGHPWSGLDPRRLGAKPPLRRGTRRPTAPTDTKEA